jgi:hypothetical protein
MSLLGCSFMTMKRAIENRIRMRLPTSRPVEL